MGSSCTRLYMEGKVYAVISTVPGNGGKYSAFHLAYQAKKMTNSGYGNVLLVDFDFNYPYLAHGLVKEDEQHGFDSLFSLISPLEPLPREALHSQVTETKVGIDVLKGTATAGSTEHIEMEHIEKIIDCAKSIYDVVIVSLRVSPTCPGMVQTLIMCDRLVLVARDNHTNAASMERTIRKVEPYYASDEPIGVLYNHYLSETDAKVNEAIARSGVRAEALGFIQFDPKTVDHADMMKKRRSSRSLNGHAWPEIYTKMIRRNS